MLTMSASEDLTQDQANAAIAVIFYAGTSSDTLGAKTLGVGINMGSHLAWCSSGANAYNSSSYATDTIDGMANMRT